LLAFAPQQSAAYSVQTHEQLIDLSWTTSITPLLRSRFPAITDAQLREAHAYAYGGCAIQDLGYYPFGSDLFSELTHYVRSGDFVQSLLRNAQTPDELAFGIGALSHYVGDSVGHAEAVNPSVAIEFPDLRKKYGPAISYADGPHQHVRTEFAFDINEITKRRFAPSAYLRHVGLNVPDRLLKKAFYETYGLDLRHVLGKRGPTIRGYRFAVRSFLPRIAYAEAVLHRGSFPADTPNESFDRLKKDLAQAEFENGWNQYRKKPGIGTYTLAGLIFVLPKIGKLSMLAIRGPEPQTHDLYVESLNRAIESLRQLFANSQTGTRPSLPNLDLDTGAPVRPGSYPLTDETYAKLLDEITRYPTRAVPLGLVQDIEQFYSDSTAPIVTKRNSHKWARVQSQLTTLRSMLARPEPTGEL